MENASYLKDWVEPDYQKKCKSVNDNIKKAKKMKRRFKFFEFCLVINSAFFITALAFTILFRFDTDTTIFTLYLFAVLSLNIYSYHYTKKEMNRLIKNISKNVKGNKKISFN